MFGIPGQTMDIWIRTLERVTALPVDHISCYSLSLEEDTPFLTRFQNDHTMIPSPETTVEMYRLLVELAGEKGFLKYELSNFALPGMECLHNMGYWTFRPYIGIGAGAHSFDGSKRTWNHTDPDEYIESYTQGNGRPAGEEIVNERSRALEILMLSLRTRAGLDVDDYSHKYAVDPAAFVKMVGEYIHAGLMEKGEGGSVRIATGGVMMADEIIADLAVECMN
jgi:oxygen-independent coproporphyrinogen-3 oxidase